MFLGGFYPLSKDEGMAGLMIIYRSHMVSSVMLDDGGRYMLDVGFGGRRYVRPLLLLDAGDPDSRDRR